MRQLDGARQDRGGTVAEYAILLGLLGTVILVAVSLLGGSLVATFQRSADGLSDPTSVLGSTIGGPGDGGGTPPAPGGTPVTTELTGAASTDGVTWTASVAVSASGADGVVVLAAWVTDDGVSGTTSCTLAGGSCTLALPAFAADAAGPSLVTVTVSTVGDDPAVGDPVTVERP